MAARVAESRAVGALVALLLLACAACTRDFDGLFSKSTCEQGKTCDVACAPGTSCDVACPSGTSCTVTCEQDAKCSCTGAGCVLSCSGTAAKCSGGSACNRGCP